VKDLAQNLNIQVTIRHRDKASFDEVCLAPQIITLKQLSTLFPQLKHPQFFEVVGDFQAAQAESTLNAEQAKLLQAATSAPTVAAPSAVSSAFGALTELPAVYAIAPDTDVIDIVETVSAAPSLVAGAKRGREEVTPATVNGSSHDDDGIVIVDDDDATPASSVKVPRNT
jgi:hypothetical protein